MTTFPQLGAANINISAAMEQFFHGVYIWADAGTVRLQCTVVLDNLQLLQGPLINILVAFNVEGRI